MPYSRPHLSTLLARLAEPPSHIVVVAGPRQVGKSTLVRQALAGKPSNFVATDQTLTPANPWQADAFDLQAEPGRPPTAAWIVNHWLKARAMANTLPSGHYHVLAMDEIQKIPRWSDVVKGLWDEDRANNTPLHVVLLGSSPWLMQKGLTESLAGRYEPIFLSHWAYPEMQEAFDFSLQDYIYFGGYPGSAAHIREQSRWRQYVHAALIQPNIEKDILQITRVDKPALLKQLFELGCGAYSGQIVALNKLLGALQDAGNTVTLTHYLELLSQAGLLTGLHKYAGQALRQRASPPKLNAQNTALISAQHPTTFEQAQLDRSHWGRLVESAVGSHLINNAPLGVGVHYWRESPNEVDFVVSHGQNLLALEVKSGMEYTQPKGLAMFCEKFQHAKALVVGHGGVPIAEFLSQPIAHWLE